MAAKIKPAQAVEGGYSVRDIGGWWYVLEESRNGEGEGEGESLEYVRQPATLNPEYLAVVSFGTREKAEEYIKTVLLS